MSLLLEALKKAELAKKAAKEEPPASATPPFTRDRLPDISQPMEIRSDDLSLAESEPAPKRADKPALELALDEPYREAPPSPATPPSRPARTQWAPPALAECPSAASLWLPRERRARARPPRRVVLVRLVPRAEVFCNCYGAAVRTRSSRPCPARTAPARQR